VAYTVFLLLGSIGFATAILIVAAHPQRSLDPRIILGINLFTTCLVLGIVEIISKTAETLREKRELPLFKSFFGKAAFTNEGLPTVFLQAELPPITEHRKIKDISNLVLSEPPLKSGKTRPKGIGHIIPFEDLEAVLAIDREFRKYEGKIRMVLDVFRSKPLPEEGCLSIGLGYNNVTIKLAELCPGLFEVIYDDESDDLCLGNGDKGTEEECDDYALIARVLLGSSRRPVPYIICAGHTARATVVACEFLAKNWTQLADLYRQGESPRRLNECSMAVILRYNETARETPQLGKPWFALIGQQQVRHIPAGGLAKSA